MNTRFRPVKPVNMKYYRIMMFFFSRLILRFFKVKAVNADAVPERGPVILVANHLNLFDPIWLYGMLKRPLRFAASEDLFRNRLVGNLLTWFGAFPKRKAATDTSSVRNIIRVLKEGSMFGLYPEGIRTWDGLNHPLQAGIASLISRMKVPVVGCRFEGAYLAYPRWARKIRKIPVRGLFKVIYPGDAVPKDTDRIIQDLSGFLRNRDYELPLNDKKYSIRGLVRGVPKLIYRCPNCGTIEGLQVVKPLKNNRIECFSCFSSWQVTPSCRLIPLDENGNPGKHRVTLAECYGKIKNMSITPLNLEKELETDGDERLYLMSKPYYLKREAVFPKINTVSVGKLYLTDRRLIFRNSEKIILEMPLELIDSLSTDAGDRFNFVYKSMLYHIPIYAESILKWFDVINRLKKGRIAEGLEKSQVGK